METTNKKETRLNPCIPLPLPSEVMVDIVPKAKDYAVMHGMGMRFQDSYSEDSLYFAPFLLLPSTFPKKEFDKCIQVQTFLNELVHKVAYNYEFLRDTLSSTIEADDFTRRLFEIYEQVRSEGGHQEYSLGLLRSDYLIEASRSVAKQVEINTIASSFGALSSLLKPVHGFILTELGYKNLIPSLPDNNALEGLCRGMLDALKVYGNEKAHILFVVEDITYNICDQRFHEFKIKELNPDVKVVRKSLTQLAEVASLDANRKLFVDDLEIGVIYYRAGYVPDHYPSEKEWNARLILERSLAIKSPSINYHLVGTKKVQQKLAAHGILEKFLTEPHKIAAVKEIFTGLYSLDDENAEAENIIAMAIKNPENYVLKPQREGGGNNLYGEKMREVLVKITPEERKAYILMDRINPPLQKNYMIRPNRDPIFYDFVSELGIFGVVIGNGETVVYNRQVGHMLRTKLSSVDETGVAAGFGALDSVFITDG